LIRGSTSSQLARRIAAQFPRTIPSAILIDERRTAHERHGWAVGRYVIMPDHVHFCCRPEANAKTLLSLLEPAVDFMSAGRRPATAATTTPWQREFFDRGSDVSDIWQCADSGVREKL